MFTQLPVTVNYIMLRSLTSLDLMT